MAWLGLAMGLLYAGLLLGRPELLIVGAPLLTVLLVGGLGAKPPALSVEVELDADRCLEGESRTATIHLASETEVRDLEVGLVLPAGLSLEGETLRWALSLGPGERRSLEVRFTTTRWGAHRVGAVPIRALGPGGFVKFDELFDARQLLRVYPAVESLPRPLQPPHTQVFGGNYVSREAGEGIEFVDIRRFSGSDPVRRVNWRVTSRRQELHVNLRAPERNADIVLFLDVFDDVGPIGATSLDLAVRGAATVARQHLRHRDRVGLVGFGGIVDWLGPSMGHTQLFRIVDYLLDVKVSLSYSWRNLDVLPPRTLPPHAMLIAFSPLIDDRVIAALTDLHSRRFPVAVIDTLQEGSIAPGQGAEARLAYRAWKIKREEMRFALSSAGIPVAHWDAAEPLQAALASLPRPTRHRVRAGA